jgi:hypothetical protein
MQRQRALGHGQRWSAKLWPEIRQHFEALPQDELHRLERMSADSKIVAKSNRYINKAKGAAKAQAVAAPLQDRQQQRTFTRATPCRRIKCLMVTRGLPGSRLPGSRGWPRAASTHHDILKSVPNLPALPHADGNFRNLWTPSPGWESRDFWPGRRIGRGFGFRGGLLLGAAAMIGPWVV